MMEQVMDEPGCIGLCGATGVLDSKLLQAYSAEPRGPQGHA